MRLETKLVCECGLEWKEKLDFEVEHEYSAKHPGFFANALTKCPNCGYKGLVRGIIALGTQLKFYLKREFSLHFPRGGRKVETVDRSLGSVDLKVHLYEGAHNVELEAIASYLRGLLTVEVDVRDPPRSAQYDKALAETCIADFSKPGVCSARSCSGVYEGFKLQALARRFIRRKELTSCHVHVLFTPLLFATWDADDLRYHARISVLGFPSLISVRGIVEAPAKPREFYELKRAGMGERELQRLGDRFLTSEDPRLTEVAKGLVLQAVFHQIVGEPFCTDPSCRFFNAHWQEELIKAQLGKPEFCSRHEQLLRRREELN
jgi:hypothetical protein